MTTEFTVDARSLTTTGGSHVTARVLNPSGAKTDTYVTDLGDGTYHVQYTAYEEGEGQQEQGTAWGDGGRRERARPPADPLCVAGFQECIWWRFCTTRSPCPRAPSAWA